METLEAVKKKYDAALEEGKPVGIGCAMKNAGVGVGIPVSYTHLDVYKRQGLSINGYNPQGFLDILDGLWWTVDRHLTLEQTKLSAYATYIDSIENGVTTVFDHHASFGHITGSLNAIEEAAKDLGVRTCLCYEISDRDGMEKSRESVMENVNRCV